MASPETQRMGDIPEELHDQDPPFRRVGVDLDGPYLMKADIRRRSTRRDEGRLKVWLLVFVCSITSGAKLYLCRDYSEEGFLQA